MKNPELQFVLQGHDMPIVIYMLQIDPQHIVMGQTVLDLTRKYTTQAGHYMESDDLYCTMNVSQGPDIEYEKDFHGQTKHTQCTLTIKKLYCSKTRAACSVELHPEQVRLFTAHTPHVSIAKN